MHKQVFLESFLFTLNGLFFKLYGYLVLKASYKNTGNGFDFIS